MMIRDSGLLFGPQQQ